MPNTSRKHLLWIGILLSCALLLGACEENPEIVSFSERDAEVISDTLYATTDNTFPFEREAYTTLSSTRMLVGELGGYRCLPVIRFGTFRDSIIITAAEIRFHNAGARSFGSPSPFDVTAYPITQFWLADTSQIWQENPPLDNVKLDAAMGSITISPSDSLLTMTLSDSGIGRLNMWVKDQEDDSLSVNFGMLLNFDNANYIQELYSRNVTTSVDSLQPTLHISYRVPASSEPDSIALDTLQLITDAYLTSGGFTGNTDRIYTSTFANGHVSLLSFNIDSLALRYREIYPSGVITSSANMQLFIDSNNSLFNTAPLELRPIVSPIDSSGFRIEDRFIDAFGVEVDVALLNDEKNRVEVGEAGRVEAERREFIVNYIQVNFNESGVFTGFVLEDGAPTNTFRRIAFHRYNDPDPAKRPRLIIRSLKLPDERL